MGGFAGIIGGALQGLGQGMAGVGKMEMEEQAQTSRMASMKQLQQQLEIDREARIAERTKTPGTRENVELQASERQLQAADLKLGAMRDEAAMGRVRSGGTAQLSDGTFAVTGDDGKVRTVSADGSPVNVGGRSVRDFERSMMSPRERAELDVKEAQANLYRSRGEHVGATGGKASAGIGVADLEGISKSVRGALYSGKDESGMEAVLPKDWGHRLSVVQDVVAQAAQEGKVVDPVRAYQRLDASNAWYRKPDKADGGGAKTEAKTDAQPGAKRSDEAYDLRKLARQQRESGNDDYANRLEAKAEFLERYR